MEINMIATPIAGAVIGYFTNWLAIKMLFWPYEKKTIMGRHVPFTPGLIPKEKERIASTLGNAVSEYILTDEIIIDSLSSDEMKKNMSSVFSSAIEQFEFSGFSIDTVMKEAFGEKSSAISEKISAFINKKIKEVLSNPNAEEKISNFIHSKAIDSLSFELDKIDPEKTSAILKNLFLKIDRNSIENFAEKKIWSYLIEKKNDERLLCDVISPSATRGIKDYISLKIPSIVNWLVSLTEDPEIEAAIKDKISSVITKITGPFVGMFIKTDSIYVSIIESITVYFNDPENMPEIDDAVNTAVDKLLEHTVGETAAVITGEMRESAISKLVSFVTGEFFNDDMAEKLAESLKNFITSDSKTVAQLLESLNINYSENIKTFSNAAAKTILAPQTMTLVEEKLNESLSSLSQKKILLLTGRLTAELKNEISLSLTEAFFNLLPFFAPKIMSSVSISSLVEKQINSFTAQYMEELTLNIAEKELKSITAVGGFLGFIIGLFPVLTNFI